MNPNRPSPRDTDFSELEQLIASAKHYVVPSADLRPRTLEAAREIQIQREQVSKLRNFAFCVAAMWCTMLFLTSYLTENRSRFMSPSARQAEQAAIEYATQRGSSIDWGLVEVFRQLRGARSTGQ